MSEFKIYFKSTKNAKKNGKVYMGNLCEDGELKWIKPIKNNNRLTFIHPAKNGDIFVVCNYFYQQQPVDSWRGEMCWLLMLDNKLFKITKDKARQINKSLKIGGEFNKSTNSLTISNEAQLEVPDWIELWDLTKKIEQDECIDANFEEIK